MGEPVAPKPLGPLLLKLLRNLRNQPPDLCMIHRARWDTRGNHVIGKAYFVRQAAILFGLAKATHDPKISAALMDKAADIKLRVKEPSPPSSQGDDEPPAATT